MVGLLRGDAEGNGTWIWDIVGCEPGMEIQLQVQEKRCLRNREMQRGGTPSQQTILVALKSRDLCP